MFPNKINAPNSAQNRRIKYIQPLFIKDKSILGFIKVVLPIFLLESKYTNTPLNMVVGVCFSLLLPCLYPASITLLQQGHKDPSLPLTLNNTIPQCQFCNRASRNYFIFDNKGRVEKIYDPKFVLKSDKEIQLEMLKILIEKHPDEAKQIIKDINEGKI